MMSSRDVVLVDSTIVEPSLAVDCETWHLGLTERLPRAEASSMAGALEKRRLVEPALL